MKQSLWQATVELPSFNRLEGDHKTDVLVVGGGLCGLLCAHFLQQAGVDYILAEGSRIASGTTGGTTGKITFQHGLLYDSLIRRFGKEQAQMYLDANRQAFTDYEGLCRQIDCDFEKKPAYTYSLTDRNKIEKEVRAVNALGFKAVFTESTELPFAVAGAVCFEGQAQFHPLKFIRGVAGHLNIYENMPIRCLEGTAAVTGNGHITAKKIIVATHFPFINTHGGYFLKLYQHRSYVCAYEKAQKLSGMYVDEAMKGMSFRNYGDLLLIGGGDHRTGKQGGTWTELHRFAEQKYPGAVLQCEWAAQDCMSLDGIPYIGRYSSGAMPGLFVASGFNKWGMTGAMTAARLLCDMVLERDNEFVKVFSPPEKVADAAAFYQRMGDKSGTVDSVSPPLSASWLRVEVEQTGTHLGLFLSRFPL